MAIFLRRRTFFGDHDTSHLIKWITRAGTGPGKTVAKIRWSCIDACTDEGAPTCQSNEEVMKPQREVCGLWDPKIRNFRAILNRSRKRLLYTIAATALCLGSILTMRMVLGVKHNNGPDPLMVILLLVFFVMCEQCSRHFRIYKRNADFEKVLRRFKPARMSSIDTKGPAMRQMTPFDRVAIQLHVFNEDSSLPTGQFDGVELDKTKDIETA
ncbi:MAG: hypothetical protein ACRCU5_08510 [Rhizobiaceae bacterium]